MIEIKDVTLAYSGSDSLVESASARIAEGALTALIGRNGCGKSTMLRAIAGLGRNFSGEIEIDGLSLRSYSSTDLAKHLAFVATDRTRIPNLRCEDVVAMGRAPYTDWIGKLSERDRRIVRDSLSSIGMEAFATRAMDRLSDGECQRIMIARALAQDTPNILLDEPTSFLDLPNRHELARLLSRLAHESGKSILFSTHELDIALRYCDFIILISDKTLYCLPADEMRKSGLIEEKFRIPL